MSLQVVTPAQVLDVVNDDHVTAFFAEFNRDMSNKDYVKNWRCGGENDTWWRFANRGDHTPETEARIKSLLDLYGWDAFKVIRGYDRGHFTTYQVRRAV